MRHDQPMTVNSVSTSYPIDPPIHVEANKNFEFTIAGDVLVIRHGESIAVYHRSAMSNGNYVCKGTIDLSDPEDKVTP